MLEEKEKLGKREGTFLKGRKKVWLSQFQVFGEEGERKELRGLAFVCEKKRGRGKLCWRRKK